MNPYPFKPILNRIVVRPDPEITQVGSIIIPPIAKAEECDGEKYLTGEFVVTTGTVLACGPGLRHKKGHILPVQLKPGDRVEFRRVGDGAAGVPLNIEGENVLLMREDDVIGLHV
jgi:chaperonin GroES